MYKQLLACALLLAAQLAGAQSSAPATTAAAPTPVRVLPFQVKNGYMLVAGQANGVPGQLMFDTGNPYSFFLNNHRIPLSMATQTASGSAGSGQRIVVFEQPELDSLSLAGGWRFTKLPHVRHSNFGFVEAGITPDFLGFIGYDFLKAYRFEIDYARGTVTLAPVASPALATPRSASGLELPFGVASGKEQLPQLRIGFGPDTLLATLDTGTPGELYLTSATRRRLEQAGYLSREPGHPTGRGKTYALRQAALGGQLLVLEHLTLLPGRHDRLSLGYEFLKNYRSVWNYAARTLQLLAP